jgi:hypothetical protein
MVVRKVIEDDERLVRCALNVIVEPGGARPGVVPFDELDAPRPNAH